MQDKRNQKNRPGQVPFPDFAKKREPLNIVSMAQDAPTPRDFVLPGLPAGKVGMLHGWGGVSKSFWALQASYQVAAGGACDFNLAALVPGRRSGYRVAFFSFEDEPIDFHHRIYAIANEWTRDREIAAWFWDISSDFLKIYPFAGEDAVLFDEEIRATDAWREVTGICKSTQGLRLIVIDTLARVHLGEENSNGQMSALLAKFEWLARVTGASVLLVHHEGKGSQGNGDAGNSAARGASALSANARWSARMRTMTREEARKRWPGDADGDPDYDAYLDEKRREWVRLEQDKVSYSKNPPGVWLHKTENGVLVRDELPPVARKKGGRDDF